MQSMMTSNSNSLIQEGLLQVPTPAPSKSNHLVLDLQWAAKAASLMKEMAAVAYYCKAPSHEPQDCDHN